MKLARLSKNKVIQLLKTGGLRLKVGGFNVCLSSSVTEVADHLLCLYGHFDVVNNEDFIDFYTSIEPPSIVRRFFRAQINFSFDGYIPFKPLPYNQASAMFEWGLNWCIANYSHHYLVIHAAVVERNGQAFIFPGTPGSGKSTLCAALVCSGWRLLSDEMTLVSIFDGLVYPVPRPISLKNKSLEIIRNFSPDVIMGPVVDNTAKGAIGHVRPPDESVELGKNPAKPAKMVFPKYLEGSNTDLIPLSKSRSLLKVAENSFNYNILGIQGFNTAGDLINASDCYEFKYCRLEEAVALFTELAN
ncbi:MAG: HprK-related kinase A [Methylococcales bacterium]|nr:HprK-related kinase A [Methylococcales bacterium]